MENKSLEYVTLHNVLQIMAPVFARMAVMYDPVQKKLTEHMVEVIGLVACGEENEELLTPCYMCTNSLGMFWVPDLEPTFICYVKPGEDVDASTVSDKLVEIEKWWNTAKKDIEVTKTETKGKVTYIKRKEKDDDGSGTTEDT